MSDWSNKIGYKDIIRELTSIAPETMEGQSNTSAMWYKTRLLNKILGAFDIQGLPDTWDYNFIAPVLFLSGWIGVSDTPVGLVALNCGFQERDLYYQPRKLIFANPVLGTWDRTVGKDCILIRLNPGCVGLAGMINRYAELLASIDASINVNVVNSRTAYFAQAEDKAEAEGLKRVLDEISRGFPAVFWRRKKKLADDGDIKQHFQHVPVKDAFIAPELVETKRMILEDFDREMGFSMVAKKERLIDREMSTNQAEMRNNIAEMLHSIRAGFDATNAMFGTDLSITFAEEVTSYESDTLRGVQEQADTV